MNHLKLFSVSERYIRYLQSHFPNIYLNKEKTRQHTRKYIGIVLKINGYNYYVPLFSPKPTDYQRAGNSLVIKKSIIPIIRITSKNSNGLKELKGTIRISRMIPVPDSELIPYCISNEPDSKYKDLVSDEYLFIQRHSETIMKYAQIMYQQKLNNDTSAKYVEAALNYPKLEELCNLYDSLPL